MNKQIYTITELSKELNQARQNVRRRLIKLGIKAINESNREYKTDPLKYNYQALTELAEDFGVVLSTTNSNTNEQASSTNEQAEKGLIEVLKDQLKHEREQNTELLKLLNQQQQLTLISNKKLEVLKLELEDPEQKNIEQEKKRKWYDLFRRKGE